VPRGRFVEGASLGDHFGDPDFTEGIALLGAGAPVHFTMPGAPRVSSSDPSPSLLAGSDIIGAAELKKFITSPSSESLSAMSHTNRRRGKFQSIVRKKKAGEGKEGEGKEGEGKEGEDRNRETGGKEGEVGRSGMRGVDRCR